MPLWPSPLAFAPGLARRPVCLPSSATLDAGGRPRLDMPQGIPQTHMRGHPTDDAWQPGSVQETGWGAARGRDQDSPGSWLQQGVRHSRHGVPDGLTLQALYNMSMALGVGVVLLRSILAAGRYPNWGVSALGLQSNHVEYQENSKF